MTQVTGFNAWSSAADDLLAVLITDVEEPDEGYYDRAIDFHGLMPHHFPQGKHRALLTAIMNLKEKRDVINPNTVIAAAGSLVTLNWYVELVALADNGFDDTIRGKTFDSNAELIKMHGARANLVERLQGSIKTLTGGGDLEKEVDSLVGSLASSGNDRISNVTIKESVSEVELLLAQENSDFISTGIDAVDTDTNGLRPSQIWFLAGPYKSSKTRVAYNMIKSVAEQGISCAMLSRENQKVMITAQFICMCAVQWLLERETYRENNPAYSISPTNLMMARNTYKNWQPRIRAEAIDVGIKAAKKLESIMRIYDATAEGGKLSDVSSIRQIIRRDKRLYGGEKFFIDHLGLITGSGSIFERTSATSNALQGISREDKGHPVTLVVLAQLNEETIRNGESYNAGVKGGGDPSADSDVMLTTHPIEISKGVYYNDRTNLKIKFNRWGASGDKSTVYFHPGSGLIMNVEVSDNHDQ